MMRQHKLRAVWLKLGLGLGLLTAVAATSPSSAQESDAAGEAARYSLCLDRAQNSPKEAETMARGTASRSA